MRRAGQYVKHSIAPLRRDARPQMRGGIGFSRVRQDVSIGFLCI
jgi:hypothetical protein